MPIQSSVLDLTSWRDVNLPATGNSLEFLMSSSSSSVQSSSDWSDIWSKFELLDNVFGSVASPLWEDWEEDGMRDEAKLDEVIVGSDVKMCQGLRTHDCMWSGTCLSKEHKDKASTAAGGRCAPAPAPATPPPLMRVSCSVRCESSGSSSSAGCGSSSSSSSSVGSSHVGSSHVGANYFRTSKDIVNNNVNVANTNTNTPAYNNNSVQRTQQSVVQTIQVPSAGGGGPTRRTGVIVQKTVGRSLLIRSRTKPEVSAAPATPSACPSPAPGPSTPASPAPPPARTPTTVAQHSLSRPETPQSLSESEDDFCPLDPSLFNNLDNLRPPAGDLWDDVLAAVEEEHAAGVEPLTPSPSKASSVASGSSSGSDSSSDESTSSKSSKGSVSKGKSLARAMMSRPGGSGTTTVVSDHSYGKNTWFRLDDLGVQTPSDSEEEIDVVSLFERTSSRHRSRSSSECSSAGTSSSSACSSPGTSTSSLPTNPSPEDQEELQELTASKLLLSASLAVSRRLRTKGTGRGRGRPAKRPCSSSGDEYEESTKVPKKQRAHARHYKTSRSRFATEFEPDSKEKRHQHNNMERMRRIDLRNSFEELRALVPSLVSKERAPKVLILQDAANYCTDLKIESRQLTSQVSALKKEQERLRSNLSCLRKRLAAKR